MMRGDGGARVDRDKPSRTETPLGRRNPCELRERRQSIAASGAEMAERVADADDLVLELLAGCETRATATDELERTLRCLRGIDKEADDLASVDLGAMSVYLPLNQPLYGLVLFGVVPSFAARTVYVRPPVLMRPVTRRLVDLLFPPSVCNLVICEEARGWFLEHAVTRSEAVLFTGRWENGQAVGARLSPEQLLLFNGPGVNPFVVGADADLKAAAESLAEARTYNSGQDCAAPDAVLVASEVLDEFLSELRSVLVRLEVGSSYPTGAAVGPLMTRQSLELVAQCLTTHATRVVFGGRIDEERNLVNPTVIRFGRPAELPLEEFFAPIFCVAPFRDIEELRGYFASRWYQDHRMYVSQFGSVPEGLEDLHGSVELRERNVLDVENGNEPFGGYGPHSNFVRHAGITVPRPILISRELARAFGPLP